MEIHKCLVCDKDFQSKPCLIDHMKENHSDLGFPCEKCGRKFPNKGQLESHVAKIHTPKVTCSACKKEFTKTL